MGSGPQCRVGGMAWGWWIHRSYCSVNRSHKEDGLPLPAERPAAGRGSASTIFALTPGGAWPEPDTAAAPHRRLPVNQINGHNVKMDMDINMETVEEHAHGRRFLRV